MKKGELGSNMVVIIFALLILFILLMLAFKFKGIPEGGFFDVF
jgi:hypothetical protein